MDIFQQNLMDGGGGPQLHPLDMAQNPSESELARLRDDDLDSTKSGSDNHEGPASGDDLHDERQKKKRYHRHTQHQIQEMEAWVLPWIVFFFISMMIFFTRFLNDLVILFLDIDFSRSVHTRMISKGRNWGVN